MWKNSPKCGISRRLPATAPRRSDGMNSICVSDTGTLMIQIGDTRVTGETGLIGTRSTINGGDAQLKKVRGQGARLLDPLQNAVPMPEFGQARRVPWLANPSPPLPPPPGEWSAAGADLNHPQCPPLWSGSSTMYVRAAPRQSSSWFLPSQSSVVRTRRRDLVSVCGFRLNLW